MQPTVWPVGLKKQVTQWLIAVCYLPSRWVQSQLVSCMCVYLCVCVIAKPLQPDCTRKSMRCCPRSHCHSKCFTVCAWWSVWTVNAYVCFFSTLRSFMEPSQSRKTFLFLFKKKIWFIKIKKPNHVWDFGVLYLNFWWVARPRAWLCACWHVFCFFYSWIYVNMNRFKRTKCPRTQKKNESK